MLNVLKLNSLQQWFLIDGPNKIRCRNFVHILELVAFFLLVTPHWWLNCAIIPKSTIAFIFRCIWKSIFQFSHVLPVLFYWFYLLFSCSFDAVEHTFPVGIKNRNKLKYKSFEMLLDEKKNVENYKFIISAVIS